MSFGSHVHEDEDIPAASANVQCVEATTDKDAEQVERTDKLREKPHFTSLNSPTVVDSRALGKLAML